MLKYYLINLTKTLNKIFLICIEENILIKKNM